jgi:Cu/Ag efflux protein CusF
MNKKLLTGYIAGASIFALAAAGQAQNMPSSPKSNDAPIDSKSNASKRATGEVTSVDASSGKLMVKTATDELNLDVKGSTAKKSLSNIKVGDKVNIAYQDKGGSLVANSISKASGKASSSAASHDDSGASSDKSDMGTSKKSR